MRFSTADFLRNQPHATAWLLVGALAYALATALAQAEIAIPYWLVYSPLEVGTDLVLAAGLGLSVVQAWTHRHEASLRGHWMLAMAALAMIGVIQGTDWLARDYWDVDSQFTVPLWTAAAVTLWLFFRAYRREVWVWRFWLAGLAIQLVGNLSEFGEYSLRLPVEHREPLALFTEFAELAAIECYVIALLIAAGSPALGRMAAAVRRFVADAVPFPGVAPALRLSGGPDPMVGIQARRAYHELGLFHGAKYPAIPVLFRQGIRQVFLALVVIWAMTRAAEVARRATGWPLMRQLRDLLVLGFRDGVDPLTYYLQELTRRGGRKEARYYLTRYETKNGLLHALNNLRPQPYPRNEMNDKLLFAECCERFALPTPPVLAVVNGDAVTWRAPRAAFDRDLFCKRRQGAGAKGALLFRRLSADRYAGPDGVERTLDQLIGLLRSRSVEKPILVQARMTNHPALADLAVDALVTTRVLTCLNTRDEPEVTHGILRIMKKLEPDWIRGPDGEYGAPIDVESGRLGPLAGDTLPSHQSRFARHPETGSGIAGRVLEDWPVLAALARRAHACFAHRVVIGWDIALTGDGPVILEGNTNFDVMFLQRVYRQPAGRTRLGELLEYHLGEIRRVRNRQ